MARLGSIYAMVSIEDRQNGGDNGTHDLAIKLVLLHHHNVNSLGISESQEAKATRTSCGSITHDSTLSDLTKL